MTGVPLAFGAGDIRSRIKNIMGYRKPAIIIVVLAVTAVIGVMFVLGSNPESNAKQSRHAASEEIRKPDSHRPSETVRDDGKETGEGEQLVMQSRRIHVFIFRCGAFQKAAGALTPMCRKKSLQITWLR